MILNRFLRYQWHHSWPGGFRNETSIYGRRTKSVAQSSSGGRELYNRDTTVLAFAKIPAYCKPCTRVYPNLLNAHNC